MAKASMNLGMYVGFLNPNKDGRLLLRRRIEEDSIIPDPNDPAKTISFRGNWENIGGAAEETSEEKVSYDYPIKEAVREAAEEVGILVSLSGMPPVYLVFFKGPKGYDLAGITPVITTEEPTKGETMYVSPQELEALVEEFISETEAKKQGKEAKGLLSGKGKRQHCMALAALCHSPNSEYQKQAKEMLAEIQKGW